MSERRYTEQEEALEITSLRRIIAAYAKYVNPIPTLPLFYPAAPYQDAAERDVKRYEWSFKMLPPAHKLICALPHLPHFCVGTSFSPWSEVPKTQMVTFCAPCLCISMNAAFIMNMLEAFEPPFDMSQYVDVGGHDRPSNMHEHDHSHVGCTHASGRGDCSTISISRSNSSLEEQHDNPKEDAKAHESSRETDNKKAWPDEGDHMAGCSHPVDSNLGTSHGVDVSCNGGTDASAAAYYQDKDVSASSAVDNVTPQHCSGSLFKLNVPPIDVDKVRCIVRNIVRDWAEEGQKERDECYKPILQEINRLFPNRSNQRPPSCLVPGAGLGRLALEISTLGFVSQGNEFSYYMLICSSFILNHTQEVNEWTIYPWIHSNCNSLSDNDQLRPVSFPDIHPSSAGITEGFSMCAGDFVEVYSEESQESAWDAVVTCFFLDTAHNIVEYIEIISKVLKDGGVWINLGPLLYHFADSYGPDDDMSIELSLEDVKKVAYHYGFVMEVEKMIETTYTANMRAMMQLQNRYRAAFWTMRKNASRAKAQKPR
ncbi:Carnosine N-methyltransferase [Dichanthelium oligosanthes]|uniref:carnosine N-methyltransferase n=1 Tax=Dichanthelium oligosanthes TaxID=888268 RepID=A0A1E5VB61_9POAL|nr:Carnosine N-methyltransferase [Dichanthelium oligosanthes]